MKKTMCVLCVCVAVLAAAFAFTGCTPEETTVKATLLENTENRVVLRAETTGGSLEDARRALADEGKLTFTVSSGQYGAFIESVNGHAADGAKNEFWAVYTSVGEHEGVTYSNAEYGTFEWDGAVLGSASYGVSQLPLLKDALYALVFTSF